MGDDARVAEGFAMMVTHIGDAMDNLARLTSVSIPDARNPEATPEPAA
jgi:hypothetical protein